MTRGRFIDTGLCPQVLHLAGCKIDLLGHSVRLAARGAHLSVQGDDETVLAGLALDLLDGGKHVDGTHDTVSKLLIHDGLDGLSVVEHGLPPQSLISTPSGSEATNTHRPRMALLGAGSLLMWYWNLP